MIDQGMNPVHHKFSRRQWHRLFFPVLLVSLIVISFLAGCQIQNLVDSSTSTTATAGLPTTGNDTAAMPAANSTPVPTASLPDNSLTLVIWLPPQFDPESNSPAGVHIKNRLESFQTEYPNLTINVRLKALDGRGGLLDSLANASMAAPDALPALVALQYRDLESAALKGLLLPLDDKTQVYTNADWLPYATQLGVIQGKHYGIPFAGDALALVYRPSQTPYPPATWQELSLQNLPVIFPAADPEATVVTTLYLAAGGNLLDQNNSPVLETAPLQKSFTILNNGIKSGAFPSWLSQYATFTDSWNAYKEQTSAYAITWTSQYLSNPPANSAITALPKTNSKNFTLAQGWVLCVPEMTSQSQKYAVLLAEYLSDPNYVDGLDQLAGYLPVYKSGLSINKDPQLNQSLSDITSSTQILPAGSTINLIGPILEGSATQLIKLQVSYQQAINQALDHFKK